MAKGRNPISFDSLVDPNFKQQVIQVFVDIEASATKNIKLIEKRFKDMQSVLSKADPSTDGGQSEIEKLTSSIKKLEAELKKLKTTRDDSKKSLSELEKAEKKLTELQSKEALKLSKVNEKIIEQRKANKDLAREKLGLNNLYQTESKRLNDLRIKYKNLALSQGENSKSTIKLKAEITALDAKLKRVDASVGQFQRSVGNYSKAVGGIKNALGAIGITTGLFAVVEFFKNSTKILNEFEKSFTTVLTLLDSKQISEYSDTLQEASLNQIKLGFSVEDTNKALFDAISAGISAADSITFMNQASILAIAGNTSLSNSVTGLSAIMNAYRLDISETEQVAAAFFSAQKFGVTDVEKLSQAVGKVAPIAKQAGIGYKELLSGFAILTKQGLSTDIATTALKSSITALIKPSTEAQKKFKELGIETGASALRANGFFKTLVQISQAAEKDIDVLSQLIPSVEALTGVGALGTAQLEEYHQILSVVANDYGENSSIVKGYEQQQKTLTQTISRLGGEWKAYIIDLGNATSATSNLSRVVGFVANNLRTIIKVITTVTSLLLAYKLVIFAITTAKVIYTTAVKAAAVATRIFNTVIKDNPIGFLLGLLTTLIATLGVFAFKAREATKEQSNLNKELEKTGKIAQADKIKQLLRDLGVLKKELREVTKGISREVEVLDTSSASLIKLADSIKNLTKAEIDSVNTFVEEAILELKRDGVVLPEVGKIITGELPESVQKLQSLTNILELIKQELKEIDKIDKIDVIVKPKLSEKEFKLGNIADEEELSISAVIIPSFDDKGAIDKLIQEYVDEIDRQLNKKTSEFKPKWEDYLFRALGFKSRTEIDKFKKNVQEITTILGDELSKQLAIQEKNAEDRISITEKMIDTQTRRAEEGLVNTLAFEQGELAKAESEKLRLQQQQQRLDQIKSLFASYANYSSQNEENPLAKTFRDFALLKAAAASVKVFAETGGVVDDLPRIKEGTILQGPSHKQGGIHLIAEGKEGIFSKKEMANLGKDNFYALKGKLKSKFDSSLFENQSVMVPVMDRLKDQAIINKLDSIEKTIAGKRETETHWDSIQQMLVEKIREKGRVVTNYRKI